MGRLLVRDRRRQRGQSCRRERVRGRDGWRPLPAGNAGSHLSQDPPATSSRRSWLNRNVVGIGVADLAADANYEMVFAVLPLFITAGLGAPAVAVGLVEGIADGSSAVVKVWSGWYSDRIAWRKRLAAGGYGTTIL